MCTGPVFPQIDYAESDRALRVCYDDMQAVLRVPWVMFAARSLAVFGGFVPAAWETARPSFTTDAVELAADELRAMAILPGDAPPDPRPRLATLGFGEVRLAEVRGALDALNYGNAQYLLLITAWCEAIQGCDSGGRCASLPANATTPVITLPVGTPQGMAKLNLVDPRQVSDRVARLLRRVTDLHLHHGPSSDFRVLANWPDFLEMVLDDVLGPVVRTALYEATGQALLTHARARVQELPVAAGPGPQQALQVCTPAETAAITGLLFLFQRFILDTIAMMRATQALDGRETATSSPPSIR